MAYNKRVANITRQCSLKRGRAERMVEQGVCVWIERGVSIRDVTLAEAIAARNLQAAMRDPLPFAELPGCVYRPAAGREAGARLERALAMQANNMVPATA